MVFRFRTPVKPLFWNIAENVNRIRNALQRWTLHGYSGGMMASERALLRIREEMAERKLTQRDLADALRCSQSRIAKIMGLGVNLRLDDLDRLAQAVGLSLTEVVRDRGMEFYAEMTPTELRILERMRQRPHVTSALMTLLDVPAPSTTNGRPAQQPAARKVGRPTNASLRAKPRT